MFGQTPRVYVSRKELMAVKKHMESSAFGNDKFLVFQEVYVHALGRLPEPSVGGWSGGQLGWRA